MIQVNHFDFLLLHSAAFDTPSGGQLAAIRSDGYRNLIRGPEEKPRGRGGEGGEGGGA